MNLKAKFDAVIIKPLEEQETTYGSIIVPDLDKDRNIHGEVVAVGPGKHSVTGDFLNTTTQVGEIVILPTMGFTKLEHDGDEYFIGAENQILAEVLKEKK
jgi:chaperonin GroES|tara:strand:+ start:2996 stop:3295 length:300 start_codon:yes stop_codon:yes gene_type:complete